MGALSGFRGDDDMALNADVNVTSLVDVAFVLLIIFMIAAPMMQGGVDVDLPRAAAKPLNGKAGDRGVARPAGQDLPRRDAGQLSRLPGDLPLDRGDAQARRRVSPGRQPGLVR